MRSKTAKKVKPRASAPKPDAVEVERPEPTPITDPKPGTLELILPPWIEGQALSEYLEAVSTWQKDCWSGAALVGSRLLVTWLGNTAQEEV